MTTTQTRKPTTRPKPTEEWAKFMARLIRAYGARAAQEDPWVVKDMMAAQAQLDGQVTQAVANLVFRGYSWSTIGAELGIGKNAAYKRWAHKVTPLVEQMEDRLAKEVADLIVFAHEDQAAALEYAATTPALAGV